MSGGDIPKPASSRLAYLFKHADRRLADFHAEALSPLAINVRELGVLMVIDRSGPASQQQIAERMSVDRTTMVAVIDSLEAKGIIARRPDTDDRRRNVIEITPPGHDILQRATAASDAVESKLLAPLSDSEARHLRSLLARLIDD